MPELETDDEDSDDENSDAESSDDEDSDDENSGTKQSDGQGFDDKVSDDAISDSESLRDDDDNEEAPLPDNLVEDEDEAAVSGDNPLRGEENNPQGEETPRTGSHQPGDSSMPYELPHVFDIMEGASEVWLWQPTMLLVARLYLTCRVSHRAVGIILSTLLLVFRALCLISASADAPRTLRTTSVRLGLQDSFFVAPM